MIHFYSAACCAVIAGALCSSAMAGPEWVEQTDAGPLLGSAQQTTGVGQLGRISGSLGGLGFGLIDAEDMFLVTVIDPTTFSMTVSGASFDPQIFVFNVTLANEALGLLANDNTIAGMLPFVDQFSTDGSGAQINLPGVYAIAISGAGRNPISNGGLIFNYVSLTEVSGPDGVGGFLPHTGWTGVGATGNYEIDLTGTGFFDVPGPGAMVVIAIGIFAPKHRRNRQIRRLDG